MTRQDEDLDGTRRYNVNVVFQRNADLEVIPILDRTVSDVPKQRFGLILEKHKAHRDSYAARNGNSNLSRSHQAGLSRLALINDDGVFV
jgi:hypothetical protein